MGWGSLGSIVGGGEGARALIILVLHECTWNAAAVSLVLPAFDDTGSIGSPPHHMVYPPGSMVPLWVTASYFLAGNREAELNLTTLSSLLLFRVFFFPLLLPPPPNLWSCSLIIIMMIML